MKEEPEGHAFERRCKAAVSSVLAARGTALPALSVGHLSVTLRVLEELVTEASALRDLVRAQLQQRKGGG